MEHASYIGLSSKWVSAKDLRCGDKVLLSNGSYGIIDSVVIDDLDHEEITYNFEVEDYHTYFVGDSKVCVHNAKCAVIHEDYETLEEAKTRANEIMGGNTHDVIKGDKTFTVSSDELWVCRSDYHGISNMPYARPAQTHLNVERLIKPFGESGNRSIINYHLWYGGK